MPVYDLSWKPPQLKQPELGFRFTTDALLLAAFACRFPAKSWCDLGTGTGVIAHILATRKPDAFGVAVERQRAILGCAVSNLSGLPVTLIDGDIRTIPWRRGRFDLIVCNPPYYEVEAGQINRDPMLAQARHTFHGSIGDFADASGVALTAAGVLCFIFPTILLENTLNALKQQGWLLIEKLAIHPYADKDAKRVCVALARRPRQPRAHRLVLHRAHRELTEQARHFLQNGQLR